MHDLIAEDLPHLIANLLATADGLFNLADALSDMHADSVAEAGLRGCTTPGWIVNLYDLSAAAESLAKRVEAWDPTE